MGFFTLDADATGPTKGAWANRKCLVFASAFCLGGFQYGYDLIEGGRFSNC